MQSPVRSARSLRTSNSRPPSARCTGVAPAAVVGSHSRSAPPGSRTRTTRLASTPGRESVGSLASPSRKSCSRSTEAKPQGLSPKRRALVPPSPAPPRSPASSSRADARPAALQDIFKAAHHCARSWHLLVPRGDGSVADEYLDTRSGEAHAIVVLAELSNPAPARCVVHDLNTSGVQLPPIPSSHY